MPINPLKEFFKKKKSEIKFARAGPGQKLSNDSNVATTSSSSDQSARQAAADAALKRFNTSTQNKPKPRPLVFTNTSNTSTNEEPDEDKPSKQAEPTNVQREITVIDGIAQRNVQIFTTEELSQRIKEPEIDDDFFRLTVEDAKLFQQRYNEEKSRNEILKTSEMRRREAEAKKPTTNIARLRFKLPNDFIIEASFSGSETANSVRDWLICTCLDKMELDLQEFDLLVGFKPLKGPEFGKTLKQIGLLPATTLTVVKRPN